jgi:hypothetical protein
LRHALASARLVLYPPQPGEEGERTARLTWQQPLELRAAADGEVETIAELGRAARLYADKLHAVARGLWVSAGRCAYCGGEISDVEGWPECRDCERVPGE